MNPNVINTIKVCSKTIDLKMFVNGKWYFLLWPATLCGSPKLFRFMCAICAFYLLSLCDLFSVDYIRLYKHCVSQIFTKISPLTLTCRRENPGWEKSQSEMYKKNFLFTTIYAHKQSSSSRSFCCQKILSTFQFFFFLASKTKIFKNENFSLFSIALQKLSRAFTTSCVFCVLLKLCSEKSTSAFT